MTTTHWLAEREDELSPAPRTRIQAVKATLPGIAEIKKHNEDGFRKGLAQLGVGARQLRARGALPRQRYLVTYRPVDSAGVATETQNATALQVFAIEFVGDVPTSTRGLLNQTWMDVGTVAIPKNAKPYLRPGREADFGRAVEGAVRKLFLDTVARGRPGGRKPRAHDVVWDELADFYRELAAELSPSGGSFRF